MLTPHLLLPARSRAHPSSHLVVGGLRPLDPDETLPRSSLVGSRWSRITSGTEQRDCASDWTIAVRHVVRSGDAPKMLNRIGAHVRGSPVMILSAVVTFSGLDEAAMSRKFAGSPP
jgi:hypothetical protein